MASWPRLGHSSALQAGSFGPRPRVARPHEFVRRLRSVPAHVHIRDVCAGVFTAEGVIEIVTLIYLS